MMLIVGGIGNMVSRFVEELSWKPTYDLSDSMAVAFQRSEVSFVVGWVLFRQLPL